MNFLYLEAYWGNLKHPYIEVEDTAVAAIRCQNGGLGSLVAGNSQHPGICSKIHMGANRQRCDFRRRLPSCGRYPARSGRRIATELIFTL